MRYEQNWQYYIIPVIFPNVSNLKYDTLKLLVQQMLVQPELAGGVHIIQS